LTTQARGLAQISAVVMDGNVGEDREVADEFVEDSDQSDSVLLAWFYPEEHSVRGKQSSWQQEQE